MAGDHIQIPDSILRRFGTRKVVQTDKGCEKGYFTYSMNMLGEIEEVNTKKYQTEVGYYDKEVETNILGHNESKIGNLIDKIEKNDEFSLYEKDCEIVKEFLIKVFLRSLITVKDYCNNSITWPLVENPPQNHLLYEFENYKNQYMKLFEGYSLNICINKTKVNFILPQSCIYNISMKDGEQIYVFPISPIMAITLNSKIENYIATDGVLEYQKIVDENVVHKFNKRAILEEYNYNKQNVFAKEKRDLEQYLDYIKVISQGDNL